MDNSASSSPPAERRTWSRAIASLLFVLVLLVLPTFFQAIGEPYYLRVATRILIFAIAASSLNLVLGYGGMISLGHAAFIGTGSYVVAILAWHFSNDVPLVLGPLAINGTMNAFVTWPLAILVSAFCAFVIGLISLRTSGLSFIMITLAFAQMIYYYSTSLQQYGGDDGLRMRSQSLLPSVDLSNRTVFYYFCLAAFLACLLDSVPSFRASARTKPACVPSASSRSAIN
jgi:branched-chain amino acid transport system permease protein